MTRQLSSSDRAEVKESGDRHAFGRSPPLTTQPTTGRNGRENEGHVLLAAAARFFARASALPCSLEFAEMCYRQAVNGASENVNMEFADGSSGVWSCAAAELSTQALPSHHTAWESMHTPDGDARSLLERIDFLAISRCPPRSGASQPAPSMPVLSTVSPGMRAQCGFHQHEDGSRSSRARGRRFFVRGEECGVARKLWLLLRLLLELLRELLQVGLRAR